MDRKYAVVTGASSGIGKAFCRLLAKDYNLVMVARREKTLQEMAEELTKEYGAESMILTADLSKTEEVERVCDEISRLDVAVFINNAGLGEAGEFTKTDLDKELFMIDVNVRAVHIFTKKMLKIFADKNEGKLLNVASSAGLLSGGPFMACYYATKSYVTSLSLAVERELKIAGKNVYVGCLCPGPVDTEFNKVANVEFALKGITPKYCAEYALKMMSKGKTLIIPTFRMKLAIFSQRLISIKSAVWQ
ncbi:MAG: SDR family oxidoreductase [Lachnospiraceae bacterium]|nr:SDR family oxidoreductase [Lachnospiraceae bacterium]